MNWRTATLADLPLLQKCAIGNGFFANNYGAANSILYQKKFRSQISTSGDWFFEKFLNGGKTFFSFPHNITGDTSDAKSAVALLAKEAELSGHPLAFEDTTSQEKDILLELFPSAKCIATPETGDYIYRTEKLASLSGKKYSRKRNHLHQFQKKYADFAFEPLHSANLESVREIEEKWLEENSAAALASGTLPDLEAEREIIFYALDHFEAFADSCGMTGGILFVSGTPAAFCVASILSQKTTDIHFEKCISAFGHDGGYAVINNEFAKTVPTEFINREEDLGIEGLRKAKLSYYPEFVLEKFSVCVS